MQDAAFMHTVTDKEQPKGQHGGQHGGDYKFHILYLFIFFNLFIFLKEFTKIREMSLGCVTFDGRLLKRSQQHVFG